jgi:hypothetical protein
MTILWISSQQGMQPEVCQIWKLLPKDHVLQVLVHGIPLRQLYYLTPPVYQFPGLA